MLLVSVVPHNPRFPKCSSLVHGVSQQDKQLYLYCTVVKNIRGIIVSGKRCLYMYSTVQYRRALEYPPSESFLVNSQDSREFQQILLEFPESRIRGLSGCWHLSPEGLREKQPQQLTETNTPMVLFASPFHSTPFC